MAETAVWTAQSISSAGQHRHFPTEYMMRSVFSSAYMGRPISLRPGARVLDVGCLYANNLVPFFDRGCECYGVDVNEEMIAASRSHAEMHRIRATFAVGTNRSLPFRDDYFDLLLSIATIHYESSMRDVVEALGEFRRVLAPGGAAIISTAGQAHDLVRTSDRIDNNLYRAGPAGGFRQGQLFAFFESANQWAATLNTVFASVSVATVSEQYATSTLQFYVARCSA